MSSKEDRQVSESELKVRASVLTMFIVPSMIVIEWERNSTWKRLIGLYTWWITNKLNLRCKVKIVSPPPEWQTKNLIADDLEEALFALCKIAQIELFKQEYKDLQASWALLSKKSSDTLSGKAPSSPFTKTSFVQVAGSRPSKETLPRRTAKGEGRNQKSL